MWLAQLKYQTFLRAAYFTTAYENSMQTLNVVYTINKSLSDYQKMIKSCSFVYLKMLPLPKVMKILLHLIAYLVTIFYIF